jgi:hypothetical protein
MVCQFYSYLTDTFHVLFLWLAFMPGNAAVVTPDTKDFWILMKTTEFGVLSLVHCLLIPSLVSIL